MICNYEDVADAMTSYRERCHAFDANASTNIKHLLLTVGRARRLEDVNPALLPALLTAFQNRAPVPDVGDLKLNIGSFGKPQYR